MNDRPEPVRRAVGLRLAAGMDQWRALVAECVDRAERWANGIAHLENWMNRRPPVPGYLTPADEQRAAAVLVHHLRGDHAAAELLQTHDGAVGSLALFKACTAVFPECWLDPDEVTARAEQYAHTLAESAAGLLDDEDDECSGSTA